MIQSNFFCEKEVGFWKKSLRGNFLKINEIIENKDKFLIIQGSLDEKYSKIGNKLYRPNNLNIKEILGGHRLFQKPSELMKILKEENIL